LCLRRALVIQGVQQSKREFLLTDGASELDFFRIVILTQSHIKQFLIFVFTRPATRIQAVQQSKKEFVITDGATELDFFHVKYPEGSGGAQRKHLHLDKEHFKKAKQSIIRINNPQDSLCLRRALIIALLLHAQKVDIPEWEKKCHSIYSH
jgi:hypothetical protein